MNSARHAALNNTQMRAPSSLLHAALRLSAPVFRLKGASLPCGAAAGPRWMLWASVTCLASPTLAGFPPTTATRVGAGRQAATTQKQNPGHGGHMLPLRCAWQQLALPACAWQPSQGVAAGDPCQISCSAPLADNMEQSWRDRAEFVRIAAKKCEELQQGEHRRRVQGPLAGNFAMCGRNDCAHARIQKRGGFPYLGGCRRGAPHGKPLPRCRSCKWCASPDTKDHVLLRPLLPPPRERRHQGALPCGGCPDGCAGGGGRRRAGGAVVAQAMQVMVQTPSMLAHAARDAAGTRWFHRSCPLVGVCPPGPGPTIPPPSRRLWVCVRASTRGRSWWRQPQRPWCWTT